MRRFLLLSAAILISCSFVRGDGCSDASSEVDRVILGPFQNRMKYSKQNYFNISDRDIGFMGFGVKYSGGLVGDFSNLQLDYDSIEGSDPEIGPASKCSSGSMTILNVRLNVKELGVQFDDFTIYTPFLRIGDAKTTASLEGMKMTLNAAKVSSAPTCTTSLEMHFDENWSLKLHFHDGVVNFVVENILNWWINPTVVRFVERYGQESAISDSAQKQFSSLFSEFTSDGNICSVLD